MSSAKRRDNKGRVFQMGEVQLDSGRYMYRYQTPFGQRKSVYSWRLTASDPTPAGKKQEKSLREKIKDIEKQLRLETFCEDLAVCELVEKYIATKTVVTHSTKTGYKYIQNILAKPVKWMYLINSSFQTIHKATTLKAAIYYKEGEYQSLTTVLSDYKVFLERSLPEDKAHILYLADPDEKTFGGIWNIRRNELPVRIDNTRELLMQPQNYSLEMAKEEFSA